MADGSVIEGGVDDDFSSRMRRTPHAAQSSVGGASRAMDDVEMEGAGTFDDDDMDDSGIVFSRQDGERVLPTRPSLLYPDDGDPVYLARWRALGGENRHAREACDNLDGMTEMLEAIHDILLPKDARMDDMMEAAVRAAEIYGVDPHSPVTNEYLRLQYSQLCFRLSKLYMGIVEESASERTVVRETLGDDGSADASSDEVRTRYYTMYIGIRQALQSALECLMALTNCHASLTHKGANTDLRLPSDPFATDVSELAPSKQVMLTLYMRLFRGGYRRMGTMLMEPRYVANAEGKNVFSGAYAFYKEIKTWVEEETSASADFNLWKNRGPPRMMVEELEDCETYYLPSMKVKQGLYASQDALMLLSGDKLRLSFFHPDDPRVVALKEAQSRAVELVKADLAAQKRDLAAQRKIIADFKEEHGTDPYAVENDDELDAIDDDVLLAMAEVTDREDALKRTKINLLLIDGLIGDMADDNMDFVAEKFEDFPFPFDDMMAFFVPEREAMPNFEGPLVCRWQKLNTPSWRHLFTYQGLNEKETDIAGFVMLVGRAMAVPSTREDWQVLYEETGFGQTGKSVKCEFIESLHKEKGAPFHHVGMINSNMERQFGMSQALGETEDRRAFVLICREITPELKYAVALSDILILASAEEGSHAVKSKAPLVCVGPHLFMWGNRGLPHDNFGEALNRRRFGIHNHKVVTHTQPELKRRIMGQERLPIMLSGAFAYYEFTAMHGARGIWNPGVLPDKFHQMREVNAMANTPLLAFFKTRHGEEIMLDSRVNAVAAAEAGGAAAPAPVCTCISFRRLRIIINEFVKANKMKDVDWSNEHELIQTMNRFSCKIVTPSQTAAADMPPCLTRSQRGKFVVGVSECMDGGGGGDSGGGGF